MKSDIEEVAKSIENACYEAGKGKIAGMTLETPDPKLLDVRDGDFDEHVSMQPTAIAYYGVLKKFSSRQLESMKRSYDRWQKKKFQEARQVLESLQKGKITIADIEAHVLMNNEEAIVKWEQDIEKLQERSDDLEVWYDAWRQKSFSLRERGLTLSDERKTTPYLEDTNPEEKPHIPKHIPHITTVVENNDSSIDRIRKMKKKSE